MNFRKTLASSVAIVLALSTTAFAAEKKTEQKEKPIYTYEQVLEKALKNSSDLSLLEQNLELMDKQSELLFQELNGIVSVELPPGAPPVTYPASVYALISKVNNLTTAKNTQKYQREALEKTMAYQVMSAMEGIESSKAAIKLSEKQLLVYQGKYNKANLMHRLGMVSENEKLMAKTELEKYQSSLEQAKLGIDSSYKGLARLMGMTNSDFDISYSVEYVPYKLIGTISDFAISKNKTNPTLIRTRLSVENLRNSRSISSASSETPLDYDNVMYNIASAEAGLKSLEDAGKAVIEGTYSAICNMEAEITSLEDNLKIAEKKLAATEANYKEGRATNLEVEEAQVAVKSLENALNTYKMKYTALVYSFENPCVLLSGGSGK